MWVLSGVWCVLRVEWVGSAHLPVVKKVRFFENIYS